MSILLKSFIVQPEGNWKMKKKRRIVIKCIGFRKPLDLFFVFISRCTFIRLRVGVSVYESQICKMDSSRNDLKCYKKVYIYENHFHYE